MAKKNKKEITADELIGKLGQNQNADERNDNPFLEKISSVSSIDMTMPDKKESDSDLDISELMRKYLPELDDLTENASYLNGKGIEDIEEADSLSDRDIVRLSGRMSSAPLDDIGEVSEETKKASAKNSFGFLDDIDDIGEFSDLTDSNDQQKLPFDDLSEYADEAEKEPEFSDIFAEVKEKAEELLFPNDETDENDDISDEIIDELSDVTTEEELSDEAEEAVSEEIIASDKESDRNEDVGEDDEDEDEEDEDEFELVDVSRSFDEDDALFTEEAGAIDEEADGDEEGEETAEEEEAAETAEDEESEEKDPEQIFMPFADGIFSEYEIDSDEKDKNEAVPDGQNDKSDESELKHDKPLTPKQKKKETDEGGVIESKRTRRFLDSLLKRSSSRLAEESGLPEEMPAEDEKEPLFSGFAPESDDRNGNESGSDNQFEFVDERNIDDSFEDDLSFGFEDSRAVDDSFEDEDRDDETEGAAAEPDVENEIFGNDDEDSSDTEEEKDGPFAALFGFGAELSDERNIDDSFDDTESEETGTSDETVPEDDKTDDIAAETEENELVGADILFGYDDYSMTEGVPEEESPENEFIKTDDDIESDLNDEMEETGETVPVDPTDINLMIAFDMDAADEVTAAQAKELGDKFEAKHVSRPARKFTLDRPEYVDKSQTQEIRKEFKKKKSSLTIRTLICAVFSVILFVFENITSLTQLFTGRAQQFAGAVDPALYPVVYIMVSLQLMLIACLCALPEILDGIKYLFKGSPRPSSMTAVLTVAGIIYSAVLCNLIKSPEEPVMLNFVVAMSAFFTLVCEIFNNKREMMNFRIIAGKKVKHVVRKMQEEESERETKAFSEAEEICDVMKLEKTDFVDNFFTRLRTPDQSTGTTMSFLMGVTVAAGILFGIFTSLRSAGDRVSVWRSVFSAMYLLAPMSVYLAFSYPFYRANRIAKEYDSTIIGEASLEEYSNASIISFDDKNVFPSYSVKVQNIRIYNNARIDRVLYYASSVFSYAGGPLQDVFEIATKDMGTSSNVKIFDTEAGFLATQVDGVNIIFGSYDALTSRGLEIPENAAEDDVDLSDELSIMYMFRESKLVAKMYIKYDMDEDIDVILKQFAGNGLYVCVRTFDPNIDEMMIAKKLNVKRVPLKIIRYSNPDEVGKFEAKVDSGLVTNASPKSLLQVISYCEKVIHTKKTNVALAVLSLMIGAALLLLLLLAGSTNILTSFLIAVYQLVWLVPAIIASKIFIR